VPRKPLSRIIVAAIMATVALTACGTREGGESAGGVTEIKLWTHNAGNKEELAAVEKFVKDFNASQQEFKVVTQAFPQAAYNDAVTAAAASGDLPCILDIDGPIVPNWAWANYLQELKLPAAVTDKLLPSVKGTYKDKLYSVGYYDVSLALFSRKSILDKNGIRVPTMDSPWTKDEFDAALVKLKGAGFNFPLDLGTGWAAEWWPYAYAPWLQSAGGDLIDRDSYKTAESKLNGPEAVAFFEYFQSLFTRGLVNKKESEAREGFDQGKIPISWNGGWAAAASRTKFGADLLILPPVDFAQGPKVGGASWQWGLSTKCKGRQAEGGQKYLEFTLSAKNIAAISEATKTIPATDEAAALTKDFGPNGQLKIFQEFSKKYAVLRPPTPAYPVISTIFDKAARDIMNGGDVKRTLDQAVREIDQNIKSNSNYGF
jgi:multiple sugar transport system substrate-binding protein